MRPASPRGFEQRVRRVCGERRRIAAGVSSRPVVAQPVAIELRGDARQSSAAICAGRSAPAVAAGQTRARGKKRGSCRLLPCQQSALARNANSERRRRSSVRTTRWQGMAPRWHSQHTLVHRAPAFGVSSRWRETDMLPSLPLGCRDCLPHPLLERGAGISSVRRGLARRSTKPTTWPRAAQTLDRRRAAAPWASGPAALRTNRLWVIAETGWRTRLWPCRDQDRHRASIADCKAKTCRCRRCGTA